MKRIIFHILVGLFILLSVRSVKAVTIGFNPLSQTTNIATSIDVAITISGLGDFTSPSLSTFDLDISYDPTILSFNTANYGDPVWGDQLDLFGLGSIKTTASGVGSVNLFELSFDLPEDLNNFQRGGFILSTLTFDAIGPGISTLGININALGDSYGDPLIANTQSGVVNAVPEPDTILLLGIGIISLWMVRKKFTVSNA